ncbi:MAG: glycosyltransferase family 4 protein, partial [candidate division WOR-3 bacterium]|nr:glycosyltransferase family 4 protein [candidate division WOR-3 bacterium]
RQKNLIALLEALKALPYELTIIGKGSMRKELQKKAEADNINVRFINSVSHLKLPEILNQHETFILPSLYEGTPKALLEAMSCGLPVIGTDIKGINDIIEHKKNGYLCDTSASSIKEGILELLGNKTVQERISINARRTILKNFSIEVGLDKEKGIYQNIEVGEI